MKDGALEIHREVRATSDCPFVFAADEHGNPPGSRLTAFLASTGGAVDPFAPGSPLSLRKVRAPRLEGPTTDEVLSNLRDLGYLAGD